MKKSDHMLCSTSLMLSSFVLVALANKRTALNVFLSYK